MSKIPAFADFEGAFFPPNTDTLDEQIREIDRIIDSYFPKDTKQQVGASVIARAELVVLFTEHSKEVDRLARIDERTDKSKSGDK